MDTPKFIITINREYGSGGHSIALKLGELLGLKVYDKSILESLTDQYNLTSDEIELLKAKKKHWWDDFCNFYRQFNSMNRRSSEERGRLTSMQLYHAEAKILRELAEQESCIIIGRSAFHIFRHNPNAWKVLLIANDEHRIRHLTQKYGITAEEASRRMTDADEARENYTLTFAGTSRYDARLYDLVCNVSNLDPDHVANFLADLARRRFGL